MSGKGTIIVAAGGTGGHLFPAQALAEVLSARGFDVQLMTDERVRDYGKAFPASAVHEVPAATLSIRQPLKLPGQLFRLWRGIRKAKAIMRRVRPKAVVGFGGYPSFPPLMAARALGIPAAIHEQNAVMGRANRAMAARVQLIASSFPDVEGVTGALAQKRVFTGNPVRAAVKAEAQAPYATPAPGEPFNLLIFGGSQGARFFSDFMPGALAALPEEQRKALRVTQQCRPEDLDRVRAAYAAAGITAELAPFFADMPQRMKAAHLVVGRSGASTIAELGVIGRPAILVPLPHALDNDQLKNALSFTAAGAGWMVAQGDLTPETFAELFLRLSNSPNELARAAHAAAAQGRADAAERLADAVSALANAGAD